MEHSHAHSHAGHHHGVSVAADRGRLQVALGLILGFMAVEVAVGIAVDSLALLADAAHMLTDAAALALSLLAIRLAARPAAGSMTFGWQRAGILSAQFNGATLLILGLLIVVEGVRRLIEPPGVEGGAVLIVALIGIVVNLGATYTLSGANRDSLNVEGAFQHLLTDLAAFVFTAIAGLVIVTTGFDRADGIASLIIAAIMLWAAYGLLRESGRVFLEAAPRGLDPDEIGRMLAGRPGVYEVHDLHVWEVTSGFPALSAHVVVDAEADCHMVRLELEHELQERFDLDHTTLQVDHRHRDELLQVDVRRS
ncbi:MAG: cation transporter [Solirubrobacterales bacterium]|nr:cation transporter [Solirubrobacterales bacterium]